VSAHLVRNIAWLSFFGTILACWLWLYAMTQQMGLGLTGRPIALLPGTTLADFCAQFLSHMTEFWPLMAMWSVMMAAMMLPTLVPTLNAYQGLMTSADGTVTGWWGLVLGYGAVWVLFSGAMSLLQLLLVALGAVDALGVATTRWLSGGLLIVAGVYQFSKLKEACRNACQSPMAFFLGRWQPGFSGGILMGLRLGVVCAGCCWAIMSLAFVGGVMSFLWMGLATAFMVFEKLPQLGSYVTKPLGAVLIPAGILVMIWHG